MSTDYTVPIPLKWGSTTLQTGSGTIEYTADLTGLDFGRQVGEEEAMYTQRHEIVLAIFAILTVNQVLHTDPGNVVIEELKEPFGLILFVPMPA